MIICCVTTKVKRGTIRSEDVPSHNISVGLLHVYDSPCVGDCIIDVDQYHSTCYYTRTVAKKSEANEGRTN